MHAPRFVVDDLRVTTLDALVELTVRPEARERKEAARLREARGMEAVMRRTILGKVEDFLVVVGILHRDATMQLEQARMHILQLLKSRVCRVLRSDVHRSERDVELLQWPPDESPAADPCGTANELHGGEAQAAHAHRQASLLLCCRGLSLRRCGGANDGVE